MKKPKFVLIATFLLAGLAFCVSWYGFSTLRNVEGSPMQGAPFWEETHKSMRLFLRGSDYQTLLGKERETDGTAGDEPSADDEEATDLDEEQSRDGRIPPALHVGRWLALISVIGASVITAILVLTQAYREFRLIGPNFLWLKSRKLKANKEEESGWRFPSNFLLGPIRPRAVVFQLPDHLVFLVDEFRRIHSFRHPVVIVVSSRDSLAGKASERAGLWVIEADYHDRHFLVASGVRLASEIFIFGDDSARNLDLAIRCQKEIGFSEPIAESAPPPKGLAVIFAQIEDPDVRFALQPETVGLPKKPEVANEGDYTYPPSVIPFSIPLNAARDLLRGGHLASKAALDHVGSRELHANARYILFGCGRWLRAFLVETIKNSVIDLSIKPVIHVVSWDAEDLEQKLRSEIPSFDQLHAVIRFHQSKSGEPEDYLETAKEIIGANLPNRDFDVPWNFISVLPDDGDNYSLATRLVAELSSPGSNPRLFNSSRIFYLARDIDAFATTATTEIGGRAILHPIGAYSRIATPDHIRQDSLFDLALLIDKGYQERTRVTRKPSDRLQPEPIFQSLTLVKREQNFSQASHIDIKLSLLGVDWDRSVDLDELIRMINDLFNYSAESLPGVTMLDGVIDNPWQISPYGEKGEPAWKLTWVDSKIDLPEEDPDTGSGFSQFHPTIQKIAEIEHLRWMQTHFLAGFRLRVRTQEEKDDKVKFDDLRRLHDCLLPLYHEDFPTDTIAYDIDSLRVLPELLRLRQRATD